MLASSVARPDPSLLASSAADFSLCVPGVTTLRLSQVAAVADRWTQDHVDAFCSLLGDLPRRDIAVSARTSSTRAASAYDRPSMQVMAMAAR